MDDASPHREVLDYIPMLAGLEEMATLTPLKAVDHTSATSDYSCDPVEHTSVSPDLLKREIPFKPPTVADTLDDWTSDSGTQREWEIRSRSDPALRQASSTPAAPTGLQTPASSRKSLASGKKGMSVSAYVEVVDLTADEPFTPAKSAYAPENAIGSGSSQRSSSSRNIALAAQPPRTPTKRNPLNKRHRGQTAVIPTLKANARSPETPLKTSSVREPLTPITPTPTSQAPVMSHAARGNGKVTYHDATRFSIKPPLWIAWSNKEYCALAESLSASFDLTAFSQTCRKPVDEIREVFNAVVLRPLRHFAEANRRGEHGISELFQLYNSYGTVARTWCRGSKKFEVQGVILGVGNGFVNIAPETGRRATTLLPVKALGAEDKAYLNQVLGDEMYEREVAAVVEADGALRTRKRKRASSISCDLDLDDPRADSSMEQEEDMSM